MQPLAHPTLLSPLWDRKENGGKSKTHGLRHRQFNRTAKEEIKVNK